LAILLSSCSIVGCSQLNGWAMNESGKSHYQAGQFVAARDEFRRAVADDPTNVDYLHNLAAASERAGDPAGAEALYRRAIAADPSHQPSYHRLAGQLAASGRGAEAAELLAGWTAAQPQNPQPIIEMAWLQQQMGDLTGAERSLRQALTLRPNHPIALAQLGSIQERTGRSAQAAALYRRSLAYDWNQPAVMARLDLLTNPRNGRQAVAINPLAQPARHPGVVAGAVGPFVQPGQPVPTQPQSPPGPIASSQSGPAIPPVRTEAPQRAASGQYRVPPGQPRQVFGPGLEFGPTVRPF
jgi:Flp pilus assembly protein TadD